MAVATPDTDRHTTRTRAPVTTLLTLTSGLTDSGDWGGTTQLGLHFDP